MTYSENMSKSIGFSFITNEVITRDTLKIVIIFQIYKQFLLKINLIFRSY